MRALVKVKDAFRGWQRSTQGFIPVPTQDETDGTQRSARQDGPHRNVVKFQKWAGRMADKFTQRLPLEVEVPASSNNIGGISVDSGVGSSSMNKKQCLTTLDLISLGVGSACGIGMYLTSGLIAGQLAGPAGVVSVIIGGIGSLLTGIHYAELVGLCPRTSGSSYFYAYVTIGELAAFLIGWGLMAEYIVSTAFAAVATSHAVNSMLGGLLDTYVYDGMARWGLPRLDFIAASICLFFTWLLAIGVQMSAKVNNALNLVNMAILVVFVSASLYLGSFSTLERNGFAPFGYEGILAATPIAYCSFIGFDAVATTGGECKDPVRSIPASIILANVLNAVIFVVVIAFLTWDVPYDRIAEHTALLDVFAEMGVAWMKYIIGIGAVAGLMAAAFGSMFPLPRILQSMAQDGLFFRYFRHFCPKRQTALRATIFTGFMTTILAGLAEVTLILELTLMSTLFTYIIVVMATLVTRFVHLDFNSECQQDTATIRQRKAHEADPNNAPRDGNENDVRGSREPPSQTTLYRAITSDLESTHTSSGRKDKSSPFDDVLWQYTEAKDGNTSRPADQLSSAKSYSLSTHSEESTVVSRSSSSPTRNVKFEDTDSLEKQHILPKDTSKHTNKKIRALYCACMYFYQRHFVKCLCCIYLGLFVLSAIVIHCRQELTGQIWLALFAVIISVVIVAVAVLMLFLRQQENRPTAGSFRSPLIPFVSVFTAAFNIYLMVMLNYIAWLLFSLWMLTGVCVYLAYGTSRSVLSSSKVPYSRMQEDDCHTIEDTIDRPGASSPP